MDGDHKVGFLPVKEFEWGCFLFFVGEVILGSQGNHMSESLGGPVMGGALKELITSVGVCCCCLGGWGQYTP